MLQTEKEANYRTYHNLENKWSSQQLLEIRD